MNNTALCTAVFLTLCACSPRSDTAPPPAAEPASAAPAASAAAENAVQTLTSKDGNIRILIQNGRFADVSGDRSFYPEGISNEELTLLRYDAARDITLYAASLGEAKTDAQTYFANLKRTLESAGLNGTRIGMATENRMNYQFSQSGPKGAFSENCIAIHQSRLYDVCAASPTASQEDLAAVLKDVSILK